MIFNVFIGEKHYSAWKSTHPHENVIPSFNILIKHKGQDRCFILFIHQAIVHLQLHTGVSVCFFSTWKDFADHIAMTTKAVAEVPFK